MEHFFCAVLLIQSRSKHPFLSSGLCTRPSPKVGVGLRQNQQ